MELPLLTVPLICEPLIGQPLSYTYGTYSHIAELDWADPQHDHLTVSILLGLDHYWRLVSGEVIHRENSPTAVKTCLRWVLSGPVEGLTEESSFVNHNVSSFFEM